jgi:transcriptional regulator with XRE-family HTH domain
MDKQNYREVLGQRLKEFREERNLSMYAVAQRGGIRIDQVKAIEEGVTNYTIDVFLGYITGSDLYMYFSIKENTTAMPDFKELIEAGSKSHPDKAAE